MEEDVETLEYMMWGEGASSRVERIDDGAWTYRDQVILAPMVRVGTLPMRVLAARYGATMVYSPELIALRLAECKRRVCERSKCIEYAPSSGGAYLRTVHGERLAVQLGAADAIVALKAACVVARDANAIDLNMGCPKSFSILGGMGAALLDQPDKVADIISTLRRNLNIPITAKIRAKPRYEDTVELCRRLERAGVAAIAVHPRLKEDRDRFQAMYDIVPDLIDSVSVPIIHNADIFYNIQIPDFKCKSRATSFMIGRGAQWNCSIFFPPHESMLPLYEVVKTYVAIADRCGNSPINTKYVVGKMVLSQRLGSKYSFVARNLVQSKTIAQIDTAISPLREHPLFSGTYKSPVSLLSRPVEMVQTTHTILGKRSHPDDHSCEDAA